MSETPRPVAFETLLAERGWVEALARSLVADDATARDVVQETWLASLRSPPHEPSALRGWLSRVVRNAANESRRRAARRERWESRAPKRRHGDSPEETVERAEAHRNVVDAVMALEEPYRTAVLLRYFEDLDNDEVARRLGVPPETARTRVKRALALLRTRLGREHDGDGRAWAVALVPLTGRGVWESGAVKGGLVMAGTTKTAVVAVVVGVSLGAIVTAGALSARDETPAPEISAKESAAAQVPRRRDAASVPRVPRPGAAATPEPAPQPVAQIVPTTVDLPLSVLQPDATPATGKVLVYATVEGSSAAKTLWWTPESTRMQIEPGTWSFTAQVEKELISKPVKVTIAAGAAPEPLVLRLESFVTGAPALARENAALTPALAWLQARQAPDGGWDNPATTGIALLTFLGTGNTHQSGTHRAAVKSGLAYLRERQGADGAFVPVGPARRFRDHAVAALAMVESYGLTESRMLLAPAQRGIDFALKSVPRDAAVDIETIAWTAMLLRSASMAKELVIDAAALEEFVASIDRVTDRATGRVHVSAGSNGSPLSDDAATAIGALVRVMAGSTVKDDAMLAMGVERLGAKLPSAGDVDLAYWYFGTLALFQTGGELWPKWVAALKAAVVDRQRMEEASDERGSWDPPGGSASESDRVWATALNTLCAQLHFRYERLPQAK